MTAPVAFLTDALRDAVAERFGADVHIDPARFVQRNRGDSAFGDLQVNAAFGLAKQLRRNPAEIAGELAEAIGAEPVFARGEVSGKAFVNFRISDGWLAEEIVRRAAAPSLLTRAPAPANVVVDFSSPNVAKEMHVGHLRSTVIGDSVSRLFEARGHAVDRVSHVGDWGTQFGMLIEYLHEKVADDELAALPVSDLNELYKRAKERFDSDEVFRDRARQAVVDLQAGEARARRTWELLCARSRAEFHEVYERLDVEVREVGESFYQPLLADVVADLERLGLIEIDDGAKCVFVEGFTNKEGDPLPLIVQKADGGYNYATTDLAALRYRIQEGADRILYVIDLGQSQHMEMIFAAARKAGWLTDEIEATHVGFGLVLGEDQKRLRTREGESIPLKDLLDEAVARATDLRVLRATVSEFEHDLAYAGLHALMVPLFDRVQALPGRQGDALRDALALRAMLAAGPA